MQTIAVVGSLNMDLVVTVPRHPKPGETILGGHYSTYPGGKGANQAVAAARTRGRVKMLGLVGDDTFGVQLRTALETSGVDISQVGVVPGPSGVALITVDAQGENTIVASPGANSLLLPDRIPLDVLATAEMVLMQLEMPLETVQFVTETAAAAGTSVLLNAAPVEPLPDRLLQGINYLIVNESEATLLSEVSIRTKNDAMMAAQRLRQRGIQTAIITLGNQGVIWSSSTGEGHLPAYEVDVVDSTAAGDAFCGGFAAYLAEGMPLETALKFANAAGAIAITRQGAQPSLGTRAEIEHLMQAH